MKTMKREKKEQESLSQQSLKEEYKYDDNPEVAIIKVSAFEIKTANIFYSFILRIHGIENFNIINGKLELKETDVALFIKRDENDNSLYGENALSLFKEVVEYLYNFYSNKKTRFNFSICSYYSDNTIYSIEIDKKSRVIINEFNIDLKKNNVTFIHQNISKSIIADIFVNRIINSKEFNFKKYFNKLKEGLDFAKNGHQTRMLIPRLASVLRGRKLAFIFSSKKDTCFDEYNISITFNPEKTSKEHYYFIMKRKNGSLDIVAMNGLEIVSISHELEHCVIYICEGIKDDNILIMECDERIRKYIKANIPDNITISEENDKNPFNATYDIFKVPNDQRKNIIGIIATIGLLCNSSEAVVMLDLNISKDTSISEGKIVLDYISSNRDKVSIAIVDILNKKEISITTSEFLKKTAELHRIFHCGYEKFIFMTYSVSLFNARKEFVKKAYEITNYLRETQSGKMKNKKYSVRNFNSRYKYSFLILMLIISVIVILHIV